MKIWGKIAAMFVMAAMVFAFAPVTSHAASSSAAPQILGITPVTGTVMKPGIAEFDVKVYARDIAIKSVTVEICQADYANGTAGDNTLATGTWKGSGKYSGTVRVKIPLTADNLAGTWRVQTMYVTDSVGNSTTYDPHGWGDQEEMGYAWTYLSDGTEYELPTIEVQEEFSYYRKVSLSHPDLVSIASEMPEGSALSLNIDSASGGIIPKEVFDAIAGQDKTLVPYGKNYQWVIKGTDIVSETKDVNVKTTLSTISEGTYDTGEDAVGVDFYTNGQLPGPVQIRFKSDYIYNLEGVKGVLYLYYINNGVPELQDNPDFDLNFDGTDKWCHFTIDHNSKYIVAGSEVNSKKHTKITSSMATLPKTSYGYTGKAIKPVPVIKVSGKKLKNNTDFTLTYKNNTKRGTATITVKGKGYYFGSFTKTFKIVKGTNPMTVKTKTVTLKYSKLKKKSLSVDKSKAFTVSKAVGKVTFKKSSGNKKISISSAGKVTVKKKLKKGTYTVKTKVTAAGNSNYKAKTKTVSLKVVVK